MVLGAGALALSVIGGDDGLLEMPELQETDSGQPGYEVSLLRAWQLHEGRLDVATPTPIPTPTPVPVVPEPTVARSVAGLETLICSYSWDCDWALQTVWCESRNNPKAIAYNNAGQAIHWGLWQLDYRFAGWDDPAVNTERAWAKYQNALAYWGDGTRPWPVCGQ